MKCTHGSKAILMRAFLLTCWVLLRSVAFGQTGEHLPGMGPRAIDNDKLQQGLARLKDGTFYLVDIDRIAEAHVVQAIPGLKKQFGQTQDERSKSKIAAALVQLREKDNTYWQYLVTEAMPALESDAPNQTAFDSKGRGIPVLSAEFVAWAKAHNLSTDAALALAFQFTQNVLFLAETRDQRAIPLLRRALSSKIFMVQALAAGGLAKIPDKASIPLIIAACQKAPADVAFAISRASLVDFNDPEAQKAAKIFADALPPREKSPQP
jgi:hypothetical protein